MANGTKLKVQARYTVFVREYGKDFNGSRAVIAAGYAPKSARVTASQLLAKPNIQEDIQRLLDRRADKLDISADRVLGELAKLAFANMADYVAIQEDGSAIIDLSHVSREQLAAVEQLETREYFENEKYEDDAQAGQRVRKIKFKLSNKREALELLGKHLRLFNDEDAASKANIGVQVIVLNS